MAYPKGPNGWFASLLGLPSSPKSRWASLTPVGDGIETCAAQLRSRWRIHPPAMMAAAIIRVMRSATESRHEGGAIRATSVRSTSARVLRYHEVISVWAIWSDGSLVLSGLRPRHPAGGHSGSRRNGAISQALVSAGWRADMPLLLVDDPYVDQHCLEWLGQVGDNVIVVGDPAHEQARELIGFEQAELGKGETLWVHGVDISDTVWAGIDPALAQIEEWCKLSILRRLRVGQGEWMERWHRFLQMVAVAEMVMDKFPVQAQRDTKSAIPAQYHRRYWMGEVPHGGYPAVGPGEHRRGGARATIRSDAWFYSVPLLFRNLWCQERHSDVARARGVSATAVAQECDVAAMLLADWRGPEGNAARHASAVLPLARAVAETPSMCSRAAVPARDVDHAWGYLAGAVQMAPQWTDVLSWTVRRPRPRRQDDTSAEQLLLPHV